DIGAYEFIDYTVYNTNDSGSGSLRQAILNANTNPDANTITFADNLEGETITLTSGELIISEDLTIDADGQNITVSGNNSSRVFLINSGTTVEMLGLTISGGNITGSGGRIYFGGGIYNDSGTLTLTNST